MTSEQIIEMVKQVDIWQPLGLPSDWSYGDYVAGPHQLQDFAKLVRNAALDEAAELCHKNLHACSWVCEDLIRSLKS